MNVAQIRQTAQDRCDELTAPSSGKYSNAYWLRQINHAQTVLAHYVGYYMKWKQLSTKAGVPQVALPPDMAWGVSTVTYEDRELDPKGVKDRDKQSPSHRKTDPDTPLEYTIVPPNMEVNPPPERTVTVDGVLLSATAGAAFTNQPTNDGIEVLSSSVSDTTQTIDIYGATYNEGEVIKETITLTGTTAVSASKTDWGDILGAELSAACVGTITIREASGNQTITTIAPAATTAGISTPTSTDGGGAHPFVRAIGSFSNQPTNDGVEVVSSSASDTTQVVTLIGTDYVTGDVTMQKVSLNGTTAVAASKTDWGDIYEVQLSAVCVGTITIREASGDLAITAIAPGSVKSGGTSTAVIGLVGTDTDGVTVTDNCVTLSGTAEDSQRMPYGMDTVTKVLLGALASTQKVIVTRGGALEALCGVLPRDLVADTETPQGMHTAFHYVLADGAAAIAQGADLYAGPQQGRTNILSEAFWNGADRYVQFLNSLQGDLSGTYQIENPYWS